MRYAHIGWCQEGTHDKIWGVICLTEPPLQRGDGKYVIFWGRRGKKLQTKLDDGRDWYFEDMFRKKLDKGYKEVDKQKLDEVYPEFETDLEKTAIWAALRA